MINGILCCVTAVLLRLLMRSRRENRLLRSDLYMANRMSDALEDQLYELSDKKTPTKRP